MPQVIKYDSRRREFRMDEARGIGITIESHNFDHFARVTYFDGLVEDYVIQRDRLGIHASNVIEIANGGVASNTVLDLRDWTLLSSSNFSNHNPQVNINEVNDFVVGRVSDSNAVNINPSVASLETIRGASNNLRALNDVNGRLNDIRPNYDRFNMDTNEDINRVLDGAGTMSNEEGVNFIRDMQARPNLTNHLINDNLIENNRRNTAEFINGVTKEIKAGRNPLGDAPIKAAIKKYRAEFNVLDGIDI